MDKTIENFVIFILASIALSLIILLIGTVFQIDWLLDIARNIGGLIEILLMFLFFGLILFIIFSTEKPDRKELNEFENMVTKQKVGKLYEKRKISWKGALRLLRKNKG